MKQTILIVDDEPTQLELIRHVISRKLGYRCIALTGGQEAINYVLSGQKPKPELLLLDLMMPEVDGMDVIRALRPQMPHLPMIVLTIYGDLEKAVAAIKAGATDFLAKPVEPARLDVSIQNALRLNQLSDEVQRLRRSVTGHIGFGDIIGSSPAIHCAIREGKRAAGSDIPVMIYGESGVGKELFARAIHGGSPRSGKPFVALNCGAIPDNLAESILFGHEKGSFTGATQRSIGKFREAEGGTLFLDEIGELKPELQVKLLRAVQEQEILPLGAARTHKINVRIISATNRNLEQAVAGGEFREDLFYRLSVFPITIPPLRERREDIPALAEFFFRRFSAIENKPIQEIADKCLDFLKSCDWPGNVRQLENSIFRAVVMCDHDRLTAEYFRGFVSPPLSAGDSSPAHNSDGINGNAIPSSALGLLDDGGDIRNICDIEADVIRFALEHYSGHMSEVARKLGIGRSTLYRKVNDLGIDTRSVA